MDKRHLQRYLRVTQLKGTQLFAVSEEYFQNPVVHDTDMAVQTAVEAIRELIKEEKK